MSKQDRQGVRTPADIERKYNLGEVKKTFDEVRNGSNVSEASLKQLEQKIQADVDAKLGDYTKTEDLPDLDEYAKKTDIPSLDEYAKKTDIPSLEEYAKLTDIPDVQDFATRRDVDDTFDVIDERVKNLAVTVQDITDGQWYDLTLGSGFIARGNNENLHPKVKASGAVVTVCGIVSNSAAMTIPSEGVVIASDIPEEWRPHMDHHFVCQSANMDLWRCAVKTDGTVTLARIGTTTARDLGANTWLPFTVTYQI